MINLSTYLTERGLTQREFARIVGVDQARISRISRMEIRPSLDLAVAIERATDGAIPAASWVTQKQEAAE